MITSSPAAIEAMQSVVERVAVPPSLILPTAPGGYNIYWRQPKGRMRVLVHPTGVMDLTVDFP
ncbi:MAG TPA: hypothetical protein VGN15_14950, partial [Ktedonobacteraceae bacterium]|nr:hypothetical protein [Ktedonobacteraceae bacterium]